MENSIIIEINLIISKENDEERAMHSKSDNIEIMINDKSDEVIEERFQALLLRYQIELETIFGYKCHKINFKELIQLEKNIEKNNLMIAINILYAKKEKYVLPMFQGKTQILKNKFF